MSSDSASNDNASNGDDSEATDYSTPFSSPQPSPQLQTSTLHDTSRSKYHMKDLSAFVSNLEQAASRAFPNREQSASRYKTVRVLLLRWKDDDLDVYYEVEDLEKAFQRYGFNTETWLIPTNNSHLKLMIKAASFVEIHESPNTLFIVYYGGHAMINPARQSTWSCKRDLKYASLEWSAIQTLFEKASSDVLLLLDCCSAASAAPLGGRAMTETIAACGWESIAAEPGRFSFTDALIRVLEEWINKPFTSAMLHSELLSRLKHEKPEVSGSQRIERRRTPIYIVTTSNLKACSIQISRIITEAQCPQEKDENIVQTQPHQPSSTPSATEVDSLTESSPNGQLKIPHVLVSLALEEDQLLDAEACSEWLSAFPALAKYAKVQSVFKSHSTLLLVSVPVMIWDLLPEDSACSFIGYVCSDNLLNSSEAVQELATAAIEPFRFRDQIQPTRNDKWKRKPKRSFETYSEDLFPGNSSAITWKLAQSAPTLPGPKSSLRFHAEEDFFQQQTKVDDFSPIVGIETPWQTGVDGYSPMVGIETSWQLCEASDSGFASSSDYLLDAMSDRGFSDRGFNMNTPIHWTEEPTLEVVNESAPSSTGYSMERVSRPAISNLSSEIEFGVFLSPKLLASQPDAVGIENLLSSYWQNFHPIYPIIHRGSFDPDKDRTLCHAMAAIGSQYLHTTRAIVDGREIHKIHEACRKEIDLCLNWTLSTMQAIFLVEIFALFRGRKTRVSTSKSFNTLCIKLAALQSDALEDPILGLDISTTHSQDEVEANLKAAWASWLCSEMQRRLMSACFILDTQQSIYHEQSMARRTHTLEYLPWLPCSEEVWEATSATIWASQLSVHKVAHISRVDEGFLSRISPGDVQKMVPFSQSILMCSQFSKLPTRDNPTYLNDYLPYALHPTLATLINVFSHYPKTNAFLLFYHTPLHDLLAIAGDTWVFSQKITPPSAFHAAQSRLKTWSISLAGAAAVRFACRLLNDEISQQFPRSASRAPNDQVAGLDGCISDYWVLYIASLVCWAFGHRYQSSSARSTLSGSSCTNEPNSTINTTASPGFAEMRATEYLTAMLNLSDEELLTSKASVKGYSSGVIQLVKLRLEKEGEGSSSRMLVDAIICLNKVAQGGKRKWF